MLSHTLSHYILTTSSGKRKTVHSPYSLKRRNFKIKTSTSKAHRQLLETPLKSCCWPRAEMAKLYPWKTWSEALGSSPRRGGGGMTYHRVRHTSAEPPPRPALLEGTTTLSAMPQCRKRAWYVRCDSIAYLLNKWTDTCNKGMKSPSFRKVKRAENARRKGMEDSHSKSLNQEFQVLNYPPNTVEGIWVQHKENGRNSQQWKKSFLMQREGKWSISHVSYWYS